MPHITIIGTFNCGNTRPDAFKNSGYFQYVLCPNDYEERVLASFSHQIQSVYYDGNISVSTEGTALEKFGVSKHPLPFYSPQTCTSHTVFCSFFPDDINKDAATTIKHIKIIIELLKNWTHYFSNFSKIWENKYEFGEHNRLATTLFLFEILSQAYNIIFEYGVSAPGYGREVVNVLNTTEKSFLFQLMTTVQLPSLKDYDTNMAMHSATHNSDISLAQVF